MSQQNKEKDIRSASGEVIKFHSSSDADAYRNHTDHLRMIHGISTDVEDAEYENSDRPESSPSAKDVPEIAAQPTNVFNLEGLPLPEFVVKLRAKRMSKLTKKPSEAA